MTERRDILKADGAYDFDPEREYIETCGFSVNTKDKTIIAEMRKLAERVVPRCYRDRVEIKIAKFDVTEINMDGCADYAQMGRWACWRYSGAQG